MIEFKPYEAKSVTRMAFQLSDKHEWMKDPTKESSYIIAEKTTETTNIIRFKAYEEPKLGDWVVKLTEADTYHCTDAVFRERNVVPE